MKQTVETSGSSLRTFLGKTLKILFSLGESVNEGLSTVLSLNETFKPGHGLPLKIAIGVGAAVIEGATCYNFQGPEIEKFVAGLKDVDEATQFDSVIDISKKRQAAYLTTRYGYMVTSLAFDYFGNCLLLSAAQAWEKDFSDGGSDYLSFLSGYEAALVLGYFAIFDLPFILCGEMAETLKEMRISMGVSTEQAGDRYFLEKVQSWVQPIARNNFWRKAIRLSGAFGDTIEHTAPFVLLISPKWLRSFYKQHSAFAWTTTGLATPVLLTIIGTVFAQTYLFEGKFCEDTLRELNYDGPGESAEDHPWLNPKVSAVLHKLLYVGGLVHGTDTALSYKLILSKQLGVSEAVTYMIITPVFLIAWAGNHFSEVLESQESLKAITLDSAKAVTAKLVKLGIFAPIRRVQQPDLESGELKPLAADIVESYLSTYQQRL